jgi:hypothetical protein
VGSFGQRDSAAEEPGSLASIVAEERFDEVLEESPASRRRAKGSNDASHGAAFAPAMKKPAVKIRHQNTITVTESPSQSRPRSDLSRLDRSKFPR